MLGKSRKGGEAQARTEPTPVTDGGTDTSELPVVGIAVLSIFYFLLNLLATLAYIGLGSIASGLGAGQAAAIAGIGAIVSIVLTIGFIVAPIGVFVEASWGWSAMAGV